MKMIYNNSLSPLEEHLVKQETIATQKSIIGYCLAFCIGLLVCYLVMKSLTSTRTKAEES